MWLSETRVRRCEDGEAPTPTTPTTTASPNDPAVPRVAADDEEQVPALAGLETPCEARAADAKRKTTRRAR